MSVRIPDFRLYDENSTADDVMSSLEQYAQQYEDGFMRYLMMYIRNDEQLRNFYIRLIYECETVKKVMRIASPIQLESLAMTVESLKNADNITSLSIYDSEFHRQLFVIAGEEKFFEWYRLQSKNLGSFLAHFWEYIGYGTKYYHDLMDIHQAIFDAIKNRDEDAAIEAMQRHFSILLFMLLGTTFEK